MTIFLYRNCYKLSSTSLLKTKYKFNMNKSENVPRESATVILKVISNLVEDLEKKVLKDNVKAKECNELKLLKEKCCSKNAVESLTSFQGIQRLVERRILVASQTVSILVSLLPSVNHYGAMVSTIGNILVLDLQEQLSLCGSFKCQYDREELQHPFVMILKFNREKSWFEIYLFIQQLMMSSDIKFEHIVKLLTPIFHCVFWSPSWRDSQFQLKLFACLMMHFEDKDVLNFTLEMLAWQNMDICFCLFLQEIFLHFLKERTNESRLIVSAFTPMLAQAIKWLVLGGHNPTLWVNLLASAVQVDKAAASAVVYILTDVIIVTPSVYINLLIDVCKSIICSSSCNKYVAHKFVAVVLNWFIHPSSLANPMYKTAEEVLKLNDGIVQANDQTARLIENKYYRTYGSADKDVKFAVDLIEMSNEWLRDRGSISRWLENLKDSNEHRIHLKLHSFIYGIILCESDNLVVDLCLDILLKLIDHYEDISFSLLCLIFYKLGRETDPIKQRTFLFSLPALAVKKENIPFIVRIVDSLTKGSSKIMTPLVLKLYLSLWEFDTRTYSYLHKMLHDSSPENSTWELNVGKALALRQLCRRDPHLYAKGLVVVLSKILNECSDHVSGLPSAIALEAVTELCKAYIIDVSGTWSAIRPKLSLDKRSKVIISLCKFFAEIPTLKISEKDYDRLACDAIPMLWNYTFAEDVEVVQHAFHALSAFRIENLPLKLFPEVYKANFKLSEEYAKRSTKDSASGDDIFNLPFVPAEYWVQFIEKIDERVVASGGVLLTAIMERELVSLPRAYFYLPPEKSEPTTYSYLPFKSICRALVTHLQKMSSSITANSPSCLKEIVRILSHEYSKLLPPLNWSFLENCMKVDVQFLRHGLTLLAKQGSVSQSAKLILDNYFKTVQWNPDMLEEIAFLYENLPLLCKSLKYNVFQSFLEKTIAICLQSALESDTPHFARNLENLTQALKNKSMQTEHKMLITKQLERILVKIPFDHKVMKNYAACATEFPLESIDNLTSGQTLSDIGWLRRACIIMSAFVMRPDIKNPLAWLHKIINVAGAFPCRRSSDHTKWLKELMWKIQESIVSSSSDSESYEQTIFLIDVFISACVVLSGHDCFFVEVDAFATDKAKKLQIFPQSLEVLFQFSEWSHLLSTVAVWLHKLLKWKRLPEAYLLPFSQSLLTLKYDKYFRDENASAGLLRAC